VKLWDVKTQKLLKIFEEGELVPPKKSLAFSGDSQRLIVMNEKKRVTVWDTRILNLVRTTTGLALNGSSSLSKDGRYALLSGARDFSPNSQETLLWDISKDEVLRLDFANGSLSRWDSENKVMISFDYDTKRNGSQVSIRDLSHGQPLGDIRLPNNATTYSADISADATHVVITATDDKTYIWEREP
jgi:WD40 repeat protein